jgi:hypothetical protein
VRGSDAVNDLMRRLQREAHRSALEGEPELPWPSLHSSLLG